MTENRQIIDEEDFEDLKESCKSCNAIGVAKFMKTFEKNNLKYNFFECEKGISVINELIKYKSLFFFGFCNLKL